MEVDKRKSRGEDKVVSGFKNMESIVKFINTHQ